MEYAGFCMVLLFGGLILSYHRALLLQNRKLLLHMEELVQQRTSELGTVPEVDELLTLIEQKNAPEVDVAGIHFTVGYLGASAKLMAQREKLLILFENLIYNAISFTPAGGTIQIMPRLVGEWVVIEVSDTGCGISAEHLPHVFEQFYTTRSQTGEGSGLGLYICKLTADELGGSIAVKSELAKGTSFTVCLPLLP